MAGTHAGNVFREKDAKTRIQGIMTATGGREFERARRKLGTLYRDIVGRKLTRISDGDVAEALSRGWADTKLYIMRTHT